MKTQELLNFYVLLGKDEKTLFPKFTKKMLINLILDLYQSSNKVL